MAAMHKQAEPTVVAAVAEIYTQVQAEHQINQLILEHLYMETAAAQGKAIMVLQVVVVAQGGLG